MWRKNKNLIKNSGNKLELCDYFAQTMPFLESLSKVATTFRRKMQKLFGCILIDT